MGSNWLSAHFWLSEGCPVVRWLSVLVVRLSPGCPGISDNQITQQFGFVWLSDLVVWLSFLVVWLSVLVVWLSAGCPGVLGNQWTTRQPRATRLSFGQPAENQRKHDSWRSRRHLVLEGNVGQEDSILYLRECPRSDFRGHRLVHCATGPKSKV